MTKKTTTTTKSASRSVTTGCLTTKTAAGSAPSQKAKKSVSTGSDTGGVVAYTKGSRFKDAQVLDVVKRVLKDF